MAGIFQGDILIKRAIELGLEDLRKNPWLIDYMLSDLVTIPYLTDKYGQKQIDACKEWFANNQIDIYMHMLSEKDRPPCITITMGPSPEKEEMKHMADQSTETVVLLPNQIGKPIPFVVKPFAVTSYDKDSGIVEVDPSLDLTGVAAGMILVDPTNGNGYPILDIGPGTIMIALETDMTASQLAIVPKNQFYTARVEHSFFQETYKVGCHAHGDPQTAMWLWAITLTALLRYRESLLEANGFTQSTISSSELMDDELYTGAGGEQAFVRAITLSGMVENSWIKSPRRIIESVVLKEKTPKSYTGGIKIISNLDTPDFIDKSQETWITKEDE